ncbi:hypothetical protein GCM10022207_18100 [Streptomyces lannensis]|uniref:Tyr recombinase domain-containing protein n=1 Tax=Streptomyces lannensis TaxID=766498 RepID=A0ABP7JU91_9ACTN
MKDRPPVRHRSSDRFRRSHRQGGKAAYLAESAQSGATAKVSVLYIGPMQAPEDAAERLGVSAGTQVLARRRLYFHTGNTLVATGGATTRELMHRMGHSSTRAALIYQHLVNGRDHQVADYVDGQIKKVKRPPHGPSGT